MKRPGQTTGNELWSRCPFCGDSADHPEKCHFSVNLLSGKYHCFRCGFSGQMPRREASNLLVNAAIDYDNLLGHHVRELRTKIQAVSEHTQRGPGIHRFSSLDRYHISLSMGKVDAFQQRLPTGKLIGWHLRRSWEKSSVNVGLRGLGFHGHSLCGEWVRLVEGPYDMIDPIHDVCTYGLPSRRQLDLLRGIPVVFCPDGDVWQDEKKRQIFATAILSCKSLIIEGAELLPNHTDPDEVPPSQRQRINSGQLIHLLNRIKKQASPRRSQLNPEYFIEGDTIWAS